jgi:hypothetical protein
VHDGGITHNLAAHGYGHLARKVRWDWTNGTGSYTDVFRECPNGCAKYPVAFLPSGIGIRLRGEGSDHAGKVVAQDERRVAPSPLGIILMLALGVQDVGMLRRTVCYADQEFVVLGAGIWHLCWAQRKNVVVMKFGDVNRLHFERIESAWSLSRVSSIVSCINEARRTCTGALRGGVLWGPRLANSAAEHKCGENIHSH